MRPAHLASAFCIALLPVALAVPATAQSGPYKVLKTVKVGGDGGFDYVNADVVNRRLYVARSGATPRISIYDLDTLAPVGEIANTAAHGAADVASNHAFGSSKPITMWDAKTLQPIKTIDVEGNPDGMLAEPSTGRVYVFAHVVPEVTAIDAKDGTVAGTIDLGGQAEQASSDGKGHLYVDVKDKGTIAVIDTKTLTVAKTYDLQGKGGACAGLAMDVKNNVLFATCRKPQAMVIVNALTGAIIDTLPIGVGTDGAVFNPATKEAFSSQIDGTLTIVKENSPTSFSVEQNLTTMQHAKTLALDTKTNHILLIGAEFGPTPEPTAPTAEVPNPPAPRAPMIPDTFTILMVGK